MVEEHELERRVGIALLDAKLDTHINVEEGRLKKIEEDVSEIKTSIQGLLDAWNAANTIGNFLKWVAGISAGLVIIWEILKRLGGK